MLDAIAPGLRAGLPVSAALGAVLEWDRQTLGATEDAQHRSALAGRLMTALAGDRPVAAVWSGEAHRTGSSALMRVAVAWQLSEAHGASLADAVAGAARVLRADLGRREQLDAALAGPRATMRLLSALPLGGPLLAAVVGMPLPTMYGSTAALACLAGGLGMLGVGRWWVARLVAWATRPGGGPTS